MKENKKKQDIIFLLGGCRSGKSSNAQQIAEATAKTGRLYLATCIPNDNEMHSRVEKHQAVRDESWTTIECPLDISDVIREKSDENNVILVDCITLWINNLLADGKNDEEIISESKGYSPNRSVKNSMALIMFLTSSRAIAESSTNT